MNLEENLKKLEEIAARLEQGGMDLDEGIKLYEQGIELTRSCLGGLNESKQRIDVVKAEMNKLMSEIKGEN